jgi:hypothetical protein
LGEYSREGKGVATLDQGGTKRGLKASDGGGVNLLEEGLPD